jgi:hypothetical protein
MKFREMKWNKKLRAWVPGLTKMGLVFVVLFAVLSVAAVTLIDLTTQVKGLLPGTNGGTGISSTATYPASGTIMTTATAVAAGQMPALTGDCVTSAGAVAVTCGTGIAHTGVDINTSYQVTATHLASALPINQGGTGSTTGFSVAGIVGLWSTCTGTKVLAADGNCYSQSGSLNFADSETPSGTIDGVNAVFNLAHTPNPAGSLQLYKNGQLMIAAGSDYTLATAAATFVSAAKPKTGDVLVASYRY